MIDTYYNLISLALVLIWFLWKIIEDSSSVIKGTATDVCFLKTAASKIWKYCQTELQKF